MIAGFGPWGDRGVSGSWRLQRNAVSGGWRVLESDGRCRATGGEDHCRAIFTGEAPRWPAGTRLLIMLHGLARSPAMFSRLGAALTGDGWTICALRYPSTHGGIAAHAEALAGLLADVPAGMPVSFVTHSLGGLVLRATLGQGRDGHLTLGRAVMLSPPNGGSALAERLGDGRAFGAILGVAGQDVRAGRPAALPIPPVPCLVIAGAVGRGINPLLAGADDGVVAVSETILDGAEHAVVRALHTFIASHPATIRLTRSFLAGGYGPEIFCTGKRSRMRRRMLSRSSR